MSIYGSDQHTSDESSVASFTPMQVMQVPCISMSHIEGVLHDQDLYFASYEEGAFIYMQDDINGTTPTWYREAAAWAAKNGYTWVRFDIDAATIKELKVYEQTNHTQRAC